MISLARIVSSILRGIQQRSELVPVRHFVRAPKGDIRAIVKQQPADRHESVIGSDREWRVTSATVGQAFLVGDIHRGSAAVTE